ncbi:Fructosamine/Ketosamine-3-kinase [Apiospora sp. TS-2023a]
MGDKYVRDQEIAVPVAVIKDIDEGVKDSEVSRELPKGTRCHGITVSGASYWARTAKIDVTDELGNETPFFIKVHQREIGREMAESEYKAMKMLFDIMPEMVAEPMAWGAYKGMGILTKYKSCFDLHASSLYAGKLAHRRM